MCPQNLHCSTVAGAFRLQAPESLHMEPANPPGSQMWLAGDGDGKVGVGVTRLQTQGSPKGKVLGLNPKLEGKLFYHHRLRRL